jgi:hypothetical protein
VNCAVFRARARCEAGCGIAIALYRVGLRLKGLALHESRPAETSWLELLRAQGETDLAGGMQRLARLAAAAHRQHVAEGISADALSPDPGAETER